MLIYEEQLETILSLEENNSDSFLSYIMKCEVILEKKALCSNSNIKSFSKTKTSEMKVYLKFKNRETLTVIIDDKKHNKKGRKMKHKSI